MYKSEDVSNSHPSIPQKWSESDHRSGVTQTAEVV